ncbi:MAG: cytochrome b [Sulfuricella sp.]|nr:cytochrome b [Sulfuricella sp.]
MNWRNNSVRYGALSIGLHWLMFVLIAAVYACIELHELFPKGSDPREALKVWHFMLGLSVFFLVFLRLLARFASGPAPRIEPPAARWQALLATAVHYALYGLMLGLPLSGWLVLSWGGKPIPFFGLHLPALVAENMDLSKQIKEIHGTVGTVGYFLIGLHAFAALFHHYVLRDNTLCRMLPGKYCAQQDAQAGRSASGGSAA